MFTKNQKRYSSLRCVSAETTLERAKAWAPMAGISRVTNITHLDRLRMPVFASIRPRGSPSAVTYGKGMLPIDAQVGAYMEGIEFYFADPKSDRITSQWGTPRDVVGADQRDDAILNFSPLFQTRVQLDQPLLLVKAHDVESGAEALVPAELVYYPAPEVGQVLFGASTNGLASGNSILEATIHGLAEVIERDIWSFEFIRDSSLLVESHSLPALVDEVMERTAQAGLKLVVRYVPNDYGLAFFSAFLFDPENPTAKFFNGGWGCHTNREIAMVRAVCEAAQSRAAFIHGARNFTRHPSIPGSSEQEVDFIRMVTSGVANANKVISYDDIPDVYTVGDLEHQWTVLLNCLRCVTNQPVYRVIFTQPDDPLHVIRIIVPTLEDFKEAKQRIGPRFKEAIDNL